METILRFNSKSVEKEILKRLTEEQTLRLIEYAQQQMEEIANSIQTYPSANAMDRTGNLLDSLAWAVYYNGNLKKLGYYRSQSAIGDSYLHEWSRDIKTSVNGHFFASQAIATHTPSISKGWEVIWVVAAPYWGYWEKGHKNVKTHSFQRFSVMSQRYDVIRKELKPSKVTFHTYVAKYGRRAKSKKK